jgi:hypothetical protein
MKPRPSSLCTHQLLQMHLGLPILVWTVRPCGGFLGTCCCCCCCRWGRPYRSGGRRRRLHAAGDTTHPDQGAGRELARVTHTVHIVSKQLCQALGVQPKPGCQPCRGITRLCCVQEAARSRRCRLQGNWRPHLLIRNEGQPKGVLSIADTRGLVGHPGKPAHGKPRSPALLVQPGLSVIVIPNHLHGCGPFRLGGWACGTAARQREHTLSGCTSCKVCCSWQGSMQGACIASMCAQRCGHHTMGAVSHVPQGSAATPRQVSSHSLGPGYMPLWLAM